MDVYVCGTCIAQQPTSNISQDGLASLEFDSHTPSPSPSARSSLSSPQPRAAFLVFRDVSTVAVTKVSSSAAREMQKEKERSREEENIAFQACTARRRSLILLLDFPTFPFPPFPLSFSLFFYFSSRTMHQEESRGGEPSPGVERCLSILEVRPPLIPYSTLSLPLELLIFPSGIYLSGKSCCI